MRRPRSFTLAVTFLLSLPVLSLSLPLHARAAPRRPAARPPRLGVLIVVDQLRADLIDRARPYLSEGGFRRLIGDGAAYAFARYSHATTHTCAGHGTIGTGTDPTRHGLIANRWIDRATTKLVQCMQDGRERVVRNDGPAQEEGSSSPRSLRVSTFADELAAASHGRSQIVSISVKDRSAIPLIGRSGIALWWSGSSFVTSSFYGKELPPFVKTWNAKRLADRYRGKAWERALPEDAYRHLGPDDPTYEHIAERTFPHKLPDAQASTKDFDSALLDTPFADELLLDFAASTLKELNLGGRPGVSDLLAVSLSANDFVGHAYGPESHEALDSIIRADREIARFLNHVEAAVGKDQMLVVLTADHGVSSSPELAAARGFDAGRLNPSHLIATADRALDTAFGNADWGVSFAVPNFYFDRARLAAKKVAIADAERVVAAALSAISGIELAVSHTELATGHTSRSDLTSAMLRSFDAERSGDVIVVVRPNFYLYMDPDAETSTHGSPWSYDSHVPVVLYGAGIRKGRYFRPVSPIDIAPTLALIFGTALPSGTTGTPLFEAIAADTRPVR